MTATFPAETVTVDGLHDLFETQRAPTAAPKPVLGVVEATPNNMHRTTRSPKSRRCRPTPTAASFAGTTNPPTTGANPNTRAGVEARRRNRLDHGHPNRRRGGE